jgi:hypothetical protein
MERMLILLMAALQDGYIEQEESIVSCTICPSDLFDWMADLTSFLSDAEADNILVRLSPLYASDERRHRIRILREVRDAAERNSER